MKKLFSILFILPLVCYGQQGQGQAQAQAQATQVNVQNKTINQVDYNIGKAAKAEAMSEATSEIKVPLTVDLYDYTHIAIVDATYTNNLTGQPSADKGTYADMAQRLGNSPLTIIEPRAYDKKKFKKNMRFLREIKNPSWLYVYYTKSIQGVDDIRKLIIRDSRNKILYNVSTRNVPMDQVISILTEI